MKKLVHELMKIMQKQLELHENVCDLSKKERELIIRNKTQDLQSCVAEQELVLDEITQVEILRSGMCARIAEEIRIPENEIKMHTIFEHVDEANKENYTRLHVKLTEVLQDIDRTNKTNAELIKGSMDYIDFSISSIEKLLNGNPTYGGSGKLAGKSALTTGIDQAV